LRSRNSTGLSFARIWYLVTADEPTTCSGGMP